MKQSVCKSILFGSMMLLPSLALANFSYSTSNSQVLPVTISLAGAPLGNGGSGGGLYTNGGATFNFSGSPTGQGVVNGKSVNNYAPPILIPGTNATTANYLSTGIGTDTLKFSAPQTQFSLLWGSVDTYNTLSFFNSGNPAAVFTLTGAQVLSPANGNQGPSGSVYVTVKGGTFNQVAFSATQNSFESTNFGSVAATPEPGFYGVLSAGLAGLAGVVYRRKRTGSATV